MPRSKRSPKEGNGTYSSICVWRIPWKEEHSRLQSLVLLAYRYTRRYTVRIDTPEGHNIQPREVTWPCSIISMAYNWKKNRLCCNVYGIPELGACSLTASAILQIKYRPTQHLHEITEKKKAMPVLFPPISLTWAALQSLDPTRLGSHDWTGEEPQQLGGVPLIEPLLNLYCPVRPGWDHRP